MTAASVPCSHCGAPLPLRDDVIIVACAYCGTRNAFGTPVVQPTARAERLRAEEVARLWHGELSPLIAMCLVGLIAIALNIVGGALILGTLVVAGLDGATAIIAVAWWWVISLYFIYRIYKRWRPRLVARGWGKGEVGLTRDRVLIVRQGRHRQEFNLSAPFVCERFWYDYQDEGQNVGAWLWLKQGQQEALVYSWRFGSTCGFAKRRDATRLERSERAALERRHPPTKIDVSDAVVREIDAVITR
jgi:hypothetical protein